MLASGAKRPAPPPRKPSPPRQNNKEEQTFKEKLEEIKRMRSGKGDTTPSTQISQRTINEEPIIPKQVQTLTGLKTFLKSFGDWMEVVSKTGKVYYYNKKTKTNQWKKPEEWVAEERRLNAPPPLPEASVFIKPEEPPIPMEDAPLPPEAPKVKMKLKIKKKVTKRLKKELKLPLSYQKNPAVRLDDSSDEDENKAKLTMENAFEDPEEDSTDSSLNKLDKADEIGHIDIKLPEPKSDNIPDTKPDPTPNSKIEPGVKTTEANTSARKFTSSAPGKERAQNLPKGSAAELAFLNITKISETTAIYGDGVNTLTTIETGNPTFFTEYNLPCCLRRCKFPKEQDVLHELKINKLKKRIFSKQFSIPGLDPKLAHLAEEAELEQFFIELKDYNHHDRLLTSRMGGTLVYKVQDEVWDRYFHKFQIKIFSGVYLECRPSGYSHNNELIYSRTGKVCSYKTFPEDEVRCQAVLQAWNMDYCLCVYANKTFTVKRDDRAWEEDLREVRRFLEKHGY